MNLHSIDDAWKTFDTLIINYIKEKKRPRVLEIGGGANPIISKEFVKKYNVDLTVVDIASEELEKSRDDYFKSIILDLTLQSLNDKFDLICSKMVLEHLSDPAALHSNVLTMLEPDARVIHFFATKYGLPSIMNLFLPERISEFIVYKLQKRNANKNGKFIAYYKDCFGPTVKSSRKFRSYGYQIIDYYGFLGHDYLSKMKVLRNLEELWNMLVMRFNSPMLTSNAIIILKKKEA